MSSEDLPQGLSSTHPAPVSPWMLPGGKMDLQGRGQGETWLRVSTSNRDHKGTVHNIRKRK